MLMVKMFNIQNHHTAGPNKYLLPDFPPLQLIIFSVSH